MPRKGKITIHETSQFDILKAEAAVMNPASTFQELQTFLAKCESLKESQRSDIITILQNATLKKRAMLRAIYGEIVARANMIAYKEARAGR